MEACSTTDNVETLRSALRSAQQQVALLIEQNSQLTSVIKGLARR